MDIIETSVDPRQVIWFRDVPKEGYWALDPNTDRHSLYVDENGSNVFNPYGSKGKYLTNAEYYEYEWTRGLPIGNGRLGAMVRGAVDKEVLQINESTVWTGAPYVDESNQPTSGATKDAWKVYRGENSDGTPADIGTVPGSISYNALRIDNSHSNEGVAAGMAEMLLQSHDGTLTLLPALPEQWPSGEFKGFKARGHFEVDVRWENRVPVKVTVASNVGGLVKVRHPRSASSIVHDEGGKAVPATRAENDTVLIFMTEAGKTYTITRYSRV